MYTAEGIPDTHLFLQGISPFKKLLLRYSKAFPRIWIIDRLCYLDNEQPGFTTFRL
jgi:hypothetical protein